MFTSPEPNLIVNDVGFSIRILGRTGIEYKEGNQSIRIDSEFLATRGILIFQDSIRRWPLPDGETIPEEKRQEILARIKDAFAFRNEPTVVQ